MIKLLFTLLLAAVTARAAEPFSLNALGAPDLAELQLPAPPAVLVPLRAEPEPQPAQKYFNAYVLKAIDYLYKNYGLKGYDINSILTHDIDYNGGVIKARRPPLTMCVAAQMEILLTAFAVYLSETGDSSPYYYLPKRSYEGLAVTDLKGHIWVNSEFNANGTADALINFGMGERRPFENLTPGDFVNINRTNRTGHAVTFLGYIDKTGRVLPRYDASVVGFKYFSSQGRLEVGQGGLDYRYAVFSKFGCPEMPYKRDCEVIYSADQRMLNTGTMLAPKFWTGVKPEASAAVPGAQTVLNRSYFLGLTTDD
ncbi:MAG: hypothetical protein NDI60_02230 [Elusimicrobiales bacterium]|nr:hypothetical protein [Elusimicrobiales bacterium]